MKIEVNKIAPTRFEVTLGATRIELEEVDVQTLLHQIEDVVRPELRGERAERYKTFLANLREANDPGIQALLRTATHEDILVLLHSSEQDARLKQKLYGNMSDNSIKMYVEDLLFEFREGVPNYRFDEAMLRLIDTVDGMVRSGTLKIEPPSR